MLHLTNHFRVSPWPGHGERCTSIDPNWTWQSLAFTWLLLAPRVSHLAHSFSLSRFWGLCKVACMLRLSLSLPLTGIYIYLDIYFAIKPNYVNLICSIRACGSTTLARSITNGPIVAKLVTIESTLIPRLLFAGCVLPKRLNKVRQWHRPMMPLN